MPSLGVNLWRLLGLILMFLGTGGVAAAQSSPHVEDNVIVSRATPSLAIDVTKDFTYIGRHSIKISDVAAGERLVFADMQAGKAKRLFIIQFEGFLPGIDNEYRYNLTTSPVVAGYPFRSNAYAFDFAKSIADNPGLESAATASFLSEKGITTPQQLMMWRSLTVVSDEKRKEMIVFYMEDLSVSNMTLKDVYDPITDKDNPAWTALQPALEQRANASYRLARLDTLGKPLKTSWQRVPLRLTH